MTLNGKELRVPGWFIATATLLVAIVVATWRVSSTFNTIVIDHQHNNEIMNEIMRRMDKRTCRIEDAMRQLGARVEPDVACGLQLQQGEPHEENR